MATFEEMKNRIADDLNRTDLTSQIGLAINRAIGYYKTYPFWFTEASQSFTIGSSNYQYDSSNSDFPSLFGRIHLLTVTSGGNTYNLQAVDMQEFQNNNVNNSTGEPAIYTLYQNKVWLYPYPDRSMSGTVYYSKTYASLSASSDTNDFTTYANDLIEARASWWVNSRILKDINTAQMDKVAEQEALENLKVATSMQSPTGIVPTCF